MVLCACKGYPKAREAALRALELDADLPEAHQALAGVHYFYDWDWRKAEAEFLEGLRLNPNLAETSRLYARLLMVLGREAEGHAQFERAERPDPLDDSTAHEYSAWCYRAATKRSSGSS